MGYEEKDLVRALGKAGSAVAVAALLSLGVVAGAQASLGVTGSTGVQGYGEGGALYQPMGVAVNGTGAGGVPAGTSYVAEQGTGRVTSFGPDGEFVRTFGRGVVSSGEDLGTATQRIDVDATAGDYRIEATSVQAEGHVTGGSNQVTISRVYTGVFQVGDTIQATGVPAGTTVTSVGSGTIQLSANATASGDPFIQAH
jgi:hypothetical protein